MGYTDSITATITCPQCDATEAKSARESGSSYGASWGNYRPFTQFDVTPDEGGGMPRIHSAICKQCKVPAQVTHS